MKSVTIVKRVRRSALRLSAAVATSGLFLFATETAASAGNWGDNHVEGRSGHPSLSSLAS